MKRFLLIPTCALMTMGFLTSCQKEEKSALELTKELTAELQKVTDHKSAKAAAPRVKILNQRLQDATVRTVTLNENALERSLDKNGRGDAYAEANVQLAREIGRVRSSIPQLEYNGEVDDEQMLLAIGVSTGKSVTDAASVRKEAGTKYMQDYLNDNHKNITAFEPYYGSEELKDALAYTADAVNAPIMKFDADGDVPAIPAPAVADDAEEGGVAEAADEEPAVDEEPASDEEPAADDSSDEPAADDSSDSDDIGGGIDVSLGDDEETVSDDSGSDDSSSDDSGSGEDIELDFDI